MRPLDAEYAFRCKRKSVLCYGAMGVRVHTRESQIHKGNEQLL